MTARPPLDPDPLVAPGFVQDDVAESIAVELFRRYGRGAIGRDGRGSYDWRSDAYLLVNRIRYLDGHQSDGRGILVGLLLAAISGAIATLIAVAVVSAAAPRSAATAIPAAELVLTGTSSSGNPSLPSGAPLSVSGPVASHPADRKVPGGGAPLPTQDSGELDSAIAGVSGDATYYCNATHLEAPLSRCTKGYPDGPGPDFYAAAGPDLRDGDWRGRIVTVERAGYRPIQVQLIDFCRCDSAVIDLYADAMWALGGTGRIEVTVYGSVGGNPTVPPTEVEP